MLNDNPAENLTEAYGVTAVEPLPEPDGADNQVGIHDEAAEHVLNNTVNEQRLVRSLAYRRAVLEQYHTQIRQLEISLNIYKEAYYGKQQRRATSGPLTWTEGYQAAESDLF